MGYPRNGDSPQATANQLIGLLDGGDVDTATDLIAELTVPRTGSSVRIEAVVRELLGMMAGAAADRLRAAGLDSEADQPYVLELFDLEGGALSIDDVDPVARAALRALLAVLAGRHDDAAAQLMLVLDNAPPADAAALLTICLMWTIHVLHPTAH